MFLFGLLSVTSLSLAVVLNAVRKAPEGYEDETGFHMIQPRARYSGASVLPRRSKKTAPTGGRLHFPFPAGHFEA